MTYKIIEKIGKYNIGDKVSDEVGIVLAKMYAKSPVERVESKATKVEEPKVEEKKAEELKKVSKYSK